ncbi:MAG TPA: acyl-CoA-binding protein [Balneolaceae bacterium]|nr:acyl-CoA-binding protein [Balneolaceae bacterium]
MAEEKTELDKRFEEAVKRASKTDLLFPPDIRLYFYAYYKRARGNHSEKTHDEDVDGSALINAFKMNAIFQVRNISIDEAKQKYIELVDEQIPK